MTLNFKMQFVWHKFLGVNGSFLAQPDNPHLFIDELGIIFYLKGLLVPIINWLLLFSSDYSLLFYIFSCNIRVCLYGK